MSDMIENETADTDVGTNHAGSGMLDRTLSVVFGSMTTDTAERRNVWWQTIAGLFYMASLAMTGGSVWESFLGKMNFSGEWLGILGTTGQITGMLAMFVLMGVADKIQARIRAIKICSIIWAGLSLVTATLILFSEHIPKLTLYILIIVPMPFGALISSLAGLLDYPVFVRTIREGIRGRVWAIQAAAGAILNIALGILVAWLIMQIPSPVNFAIIYVFGAGLMVMKGLSNNRLVELPDITVPGKSRSVSPFVAIIDLWKLKEFRMVAYPHVLRGALQATVVLIVPTYFKHFHMADQSAGYMTSIVAGATLAGAFLFGITNDRFGSGMVTFLSEIICAGALVGIVLAGSPLVFFAFLGLFWVGFIIEQNSIPLGTFEMVPTEVMGAFSSARLMILAGGGAIGAYAAGRMLDVKGAAVVFATVALLRVILGAWFFKIFGLKRPSPL